MITVLKRPSVQTEHDYVYPGDPAIDKDREDWEQELEAALESGDPAKLPLKANAKPTIFTLRQPTGRLRRSIQGIVQSAITHAIGYNEAWREIAALCLIKVRNAEGSPFGAEHTFERVPSQKYGGHRVVSDDDMDLFEQVDDGALVDALGLYVSKVMNASKNS